jgi:hypothetical protein
MRGCSVFKPQARDDETKSRDHAVIVDRSDVRHTHHSRRTGERGEGLIRSSTFPPDRFPESSPHRFAKSPIVGV